MAEPTVEPKVEETTAKPVREKRVKIKLLRDCLVGKEIIKAGNVVMATEAEAAEFCDKVITGYPQYYGYRPELLLEPGQVDPLARKDIVRAVRVAN